MTLSQRLAAAFDLRPGEEKPALILWLRSILLGATVVFSYTAASALFLSHYEATSLPYVYIVAAVVIAGTGFLYSRLEERFSTTSLFVGILILLVLSIVAIRLGLAFWGAAWLTFAAMIWFRLMMTLTGLEFWGLAGRMFTIRQGKRLFGRIGSGEVAARIVGYFSVSLLITIIGTANLLILAAICLSLSLGLLLYLIRYLGERSDAQTQGRGRVIQEKQLPDPNTSLLRDRYVLSIFAISVLAILAYYFLDYGFFAQTKLRYQRADDLARFISLFFGLVYTASFLFRTFLTGAMLQKFGIRLGLFTLPIVMIAGAVIIASAGTITPNIALLFLFFAGAKLLDEMLRMALHRPSALLLYQPFPPDKRLTTQVAAESIVEPAAIGVAGGLLLLFNALPAFSPIHLAVLLGFVSVAWLAVTVIINRSYPAVLMNALAKRHLSGEGSDLRDESSRAVLQQQVQNPDPATVIYSLRMLEALEHEALPELLGVALAHEDRSVRHYVLEGVERLQLRALLPAVRTCLQAEETLALRGQALRVLAALDEDSAFAELSAYLDHPEPELRMGAMVGLLRSGGIAGVLAAGQSFLQIVNSPLPRDRLQAAQVLQAVNIGSFYQPLEALLQDEEPEVRVAALQAAGQLRQPKLWPLVVAQLGDADTHSAAAMAAANGGVSILPLLDEAFEQHCEDTRFLIRVAQVCGQIQGDGAAAILKKRLAIADADVRSYVLRSLRRCGYRALADDIPRVEQQIVAEIEQTAWTLASQRDLGEDGGLVLLQEALNIKLAQHRARLFDLLSFLYDAHALRRVQDNLSHPSLEKRAYALEVIEVMLAAEHKRLIMPLIAELSPTQRLQSLAQLFPQPHRTREQRLQTILLDPAHFNVWTKACALDAVGRLSATNCRDAVSEVMTHPNPILAETARWAMLRLDRGVFAGPSPTGNGESETRAASPTLSPRYQGIDSMLLTIEKVIILKTVEIFQHTPDDVLAEIAALLSEVEVPAGKTIFEKGDVGDSMYVIVHGEVRVHDGELNLATLGDREVFGEMALLDAEPRMASITTNEETMLLRLDQEPFYELMDDRIEVARGIIRVLLQRLRSRVRDVNELRARLEALGVTA